MHSVHAKDSYSNVVFEIREDGLGVCVRKIEMSVYKTSNVKHNSYAAHIFR